MCIKIHVAQVAHPDSSLVGLEANSKRRTLCDSRANAGDVYRNSSDHVALCKGLIRALVVEAYLQRIEGGGRFGVYWLVDCI